MLSYSAHHLATLSRVPTPSLGTTVIDRLPKGEVIAKRTIFQPNVAREKKKRRRTPKMLTYPFKFERQVSLHYFSVVLREKKKEEVR